MALMIFVPASCHDPLFENHWLSWTHLSGDWLFCDLDESYYRSMGSEPKIPFSVCCASAVWDLYGSYFYSCIFMKIAAAIIVGFHAMMLLMQAGVCLSEEKTGTLITSLLMATSEIFVLYVLLTL